MKTAIIGAGAISYPHAKAINELGIGLVGVLDFSEERAKQLAKQYGTKTIQKMDEILDEVDMVHIFTPPSKRVEYVRQAAEAGKHIFIEKPIAISIDDAKKIVEVTSKNNVKLMISFNMRFRKGFQLLHDAVQSGQLGEIINVFIQRMGTGIGYGGVAIGASWRTDPKLACGMSIESLSHDIDMILHLVDGIKSVSANTFASLSELPQYDNNVVANFQLRNDGIGTIHASNSSYMRYSSRCVIGTKGTAILFGDDIYDFNKFVIKTDEMPYEVVTRVNDRYLSVGDHFESDSYLTIERQFKECIENNLSPSSSGEDGLRALIFSHAIIDSSKTGKAVVVDL